MAPLSFPFFKSHRASLAADSNPEPHGQRDSGLSLASPLWCRGRCAGDHGESRMSLHLHPGTEALSSLLAASPQELDSGAR